MKSSRRGDRFRAGKRLWSRADDAQLRREYPDTPTSRLARKMRRSLRAVYARAKTLGVTKSAAYLASPAACRLRRGGDVGKAFRFEKGHVPANKGLRRPGWSPGRMKETQFKKGQRGSRWVPVGSERVTKDGYLQRKVRDTPRWVDNWRYVHEMVWERRHGKVPRGYALCFKNGDKTDVRIENLELVHRRELMQRNSVHRLPKPLASAVQLLGALHRQINAREERNQP